MDYSLESIYDLQSPELEELESRLRRIEKALNEQKEFSESLIRYSAVATFAIDAGHRVIYWNRACEELTGIGAAEMVGTDNHWNRKPQRGPRPGQAVKRFYTYLRFMQKDTGRQGILEPVGSLHQRTLRCGIQPQSLSGMQGQALSRNLREQGQMKRYFPPVFLTAYFRHSVPEDLSTTSEGMFLDLKPMPLHP